MRLIEYDKQSGLSDGSYSIAGGYVSRCPVCSYIQLNREGNVLYDPSRSGQPSGALGWSTCACHFVGCSTTVQPLSLKEHEPYLAAFALGGIEACAVMCEEANFASGRCTRKTWE